MAHEAAKPDSKLASCGDGTTSHASILAVSRLDNTQREHSSPTFARFFFTCHKQEFFKFFFPPFLGRLVQTLRNAFPAQRSGHTTARGNLPALPPSSASAHLSHQEIRVPTSHLQPP